VELRKSQQCWHGNVCFLDKFRLYRDKFAHPEKVFFSRIGDIPPFTSRVTANFLLKFPNFRYYGYNDWYDTNFACIVKFADPENPLFGARIGDISHQQAEL